MSPELVAIVAAIYASQARIEAMLAANQDRARREESQAYPEEAFMHEAQHLDMLASDARRIA
jgi:hypothetical protein